MLVRRLETRQTNRRFGEEWYECGKCGLDFPRSLVIVQNGVIVCTGLGTSNCLDEPGVDAYRKYELVREQPIEPLPQINEDL